MLAFELVIYLRNLQLLLLHKLLETVFEFLLKGCFFFLSLGLPLLLFFFQVVDLLLEHLDVQFELLLDFDMVTDLGFVVL